jgi:uncharacterized protein
MEMSAFYPESIYLSYLRTVVWLNVALFFFPSVLPIIFISDPVGRSIFGTITALEVVVFFLIYLWTSPYVRSIEYRLTSGTAEYSGGVFFRRNVTVPFTKITNVDITQGPLERQFGLSTVHLQTAGAGGAQGAVAELRIHGVGDGSAIREYVLSHLASGIVPESQQKVSQSETAILSAMLAELSTIRKSLAGQSDRRG